MADNTLAESLFEAINLIASKKVSDLPYDKTVVCTITDTSKADQNEYTVTDNTSTFTAYSENTEYGLNAQVYVTIPNGDMQNKKYISGLYISDENGDYITYVSPMNSFVDLTGDLTKDKFRDKRFSLLANNPAELTTFVWDSGVVSYRNYTCLGVQADFMSLFNSADVSSGNYGLAITVKGKTENGAQIIRTMYLDSSDMYGDPFHFTVDYLQEKLFDVADLDEITNINVNFYQNANFKLTDGTEVAYKDGSINFDNNLFVSNFHIKLGELLTVYDNDTVRLICNEDLKYRLDKKPLERTMYLRWVHKIDDTLRVIDEDTDISVDESLSYDSNGIIKPNFKVHWYQRNLANGVHDELAGNFWEELPDNFNIYNRTIIPNNHVQVDKYKVIIEYPIRALKIDDMLHNRNEAYTNAYTAVQSELGTSTSWSSIVKVIQGWLQPTEEFGYEAAEELYDKLINNQAEYPASYGNSALANLKSCIDSALTIQYFESNQIEFENEVQVDLENVDLVQGLQIIVDDEADGMNGVYRLYDETNNIVNSAESRKLRNMTATYTSIALGESTLTQAEEIFWCIPVESTMIQFPELGKEYTEDDDYFLVDQLDADNDVDSAQNQRYEYLSEHRNDTYQNDLTLTPEEITEALSHELSKMSLAQYNSASQYQAAVNAVKAYYEQLMYHRLNEDYKEQISTLPNCKYAVIHRLGGELLENADEQLIEVKQSFRIKNYYVENATNNTVFCMIKKYGRVYTAEFTMHFGTAGTSGTEATLLLNLIGDNGYEVQALPYGGSVTVVPSLYDYNNQRIDFEDSGVGYKWFIKPENENAIELTTVGTQCIIKSKTNYTMLQHSHAILQATTKYNIYKPAATDSADDTGTKRSVTLTTYLPLAIVANSYISSMTGATKIIYDSNGTNPAYYKDKYQLYVGSKHEAAAATEWEMYCTDPNELGQSDSRRYYPTITTEGELLPTNMYYSGLSPISILGYALDLENEMSLAWIQPILIMQNRYGSPMLNDWDGSLTIDEDNGVILSAMVGAGIKNEDNTFSGVLMGNVALADENIGNKTGLGLYGYHHGDQSFGLNVDGTAFFGKAGSGRITFDGNKGVIQSYNFEKPTTRNGEYVHGTGLQLDLDDSTFKAYGKTGSIEIDSNQFGKPLFTIHDALDRTLFYVSSETYDPVRGTSHKAKYYLQSANYTSVDPDQENSSTYGSGALFDLEKGILNVHGAAGRVSIDGNGETTLFQIKGWKGSGNDFIKNTLMTVAPSKYYLQSLDYKANSKGFKLDLANGTIQASGFALKAGTDATGKIQINTNGAPYFSVTSGTDYTEEEINGVTHYVCYDAIDLANANAQFIYDPTGAVAGSPVIYYYSNPLQPGFYALEDYWGEYIYTDAELGPNPDNEDRKMKYYYRAENANSKVNGPMWPDSTQSFEDSQLPDGKRIYVIKDAPIIADPYTFYMDRSTGIRYFADSMGSVELTNEMRDPNEVYNYRAMRDAKRLYRQPKVPLSATGTAWENGRDYYELVNGEYKPINVVEGHNTCVIWEPKKYYFRTDFGLYMPSIQAYSGAQTYYTPVDTTRVGDNCYGYDAANNRLKKEELKTLTDDMFTPVTKTVVIPSAYFYDTAANDPNYKTLYYYSTEWEQVPATANYDGNTYRYGLKFSGSDRILTGYDIVTDGTPIYQAGKYYIQDPENYTYEVLTSWRQLSCTGNNPKNYYYNLCNNMYERCEKVIQKENDTNGYIFHPNTYYQYVANRPYLPLKEYDISLKPFYKPTNVNVIPKQANQVQAITLCDVNEQPFSVVRSTVTNRVISAEDKKLAPGLAYRSAHVSGSSLYYVNAAGTLVASDNTYRAGVEYYIRYDFGSTSPENWANAGSDHPSVKLINITKSRFELKSHNWNINTPSGMYFYLSSHSQMSRVIDAELGESGAAANNDDLDTAFGTISENHEVGGGYITGYGFYKAATADNNGNFYRYPEFILDWRAGAGHYPIKINNGAFSVAWNGRVEMTDMHAYKGRIGAWYIDDVGIYSFKPPQDRTGAWTSSGVALLSNNFSGTGDSYNLAIGVGKFKGATQTGAVDDPSATQITYERVEVTDTINEYSWDYGDRAYNETTGNYITDRIYGFTNTGLTKGKAQIPVSTTTFTYVDGKEYYKTNSIKPDGVSSAHVYYCGFDSQVTEKTTWTTNKWLIAKRIVNSYVATYYRYTGSDGRHWRESISNGVVTYINETTGEVVNELPTTTGSTNDDNTEFVIYKDKGFFVYRDGTMICFGAQIKGAEIEKGKIFQATIEEGTITKATIKNCNVTGTLRGATIIGGKISGSTISGSTISGGTIRGGTITGSTISGGTITGAAITAKGMVTAGGLTVGGANYTPKSGDFARVAEGGDHKILNDQDVAIEDHEVEITVKSAKISDSAETDSKSSGGYVNVSWTAEAGSGKFYVQDSSHKHSIGGKTVTVTLNKATVSHEITLTPSYTQLYATHVQVLASSIGAGN